MKASAPLPDKIGRYQILERVGRGGMGVLYRGFDPVLDREVAVKVMLADFSEDTEQMRPRFYREARAAAKLQHRNIVTVFEFAEEANQPHIVMEFLNGVPLGLRMTSPPPLSLDDKLDIVAQLCAGLGYAHSQGVVHRDVKPANVFLLADGTVKLLDFGIAKLATSTLTRQGDVLGSASYMSPEQVAGSESVDGRADVWSTGVLLYELLSGRKPFEGESPTNVIVKILREEPPPIDGVVQGLPKQLVAAVTSALQKDPAKRIAKAEDLGRELQFIRKALQASRELPPMEETRFASTNVLKALHDDLQKQPGGTLSAETIATASTAQGQAQPAAASSRKWVIPAGIAAAVVVGVAGWALLRGPSAPTATESRATAPPADSSPLAPPPSAAAAIAAPVSAEPNPGADASKPAAAIPPAPIQKAPAVGPVGGAPPLPPTTSPGTPPSARPTASAKPLPASPPPPASSVPRGVMVEVALSAAYPFEVFDGSNSISAASRSHQLRQPNGKALRVVAPDVFLDQLVRIDGGSERQMEWSPPGLGRLDIRAARGDCKIMVGKRDLGYGPLQPVPAVAGDYQVSLACPDGQNPVMQTTVTQGFPARVLFTK